MKKRLLPILLVSLFLTGCEFPKELSFLSFLQKEEKNNENSNNEVTNDTNNEQTINQGEEDGKSFLPIKEIVNFYKTADIDAIIPDYISQNKDASISFNQYQTDFKVYIEGSNKQEMTSYKNRLCNNEWSLIEEDLDEYYGLRFSNTDAYAMLEVGSSGQVRIYFYYDIQKPQDTTKSVDLWTCYGAMYTQKLNSIVDDISDEIDIEIEHTSKGSYDGILHDMVSAIACADYPSVSLGVPNHFATYHGCGILKSLDDYFNEIEKNDFIDEYMSENYIYDADGVQRLYSVPFAKSSEVLVYNGVFVDYCASLYPDEDLEALPTTWDEWATAVDEPTSKAGRYYSIFNYLVDNQMVLYATQNEDGRASNFSTTDSTGREMVLDFRGVDKNLTRLFCYDATDNAFITLLSQWGAKYTELPESEYTKRPIRRVGKVLFANNENLPKTIDMLKFFNKMHKNNIFCTPNELGGSYSADAFSRGNVMFSICTSASLGYLYSNNWHNRCRIAPIPYKDEENKYFISQGADICLTDSGNTEQAVKVIKALINPKYNARWAMETGFFQTTKPSVDSCEYQAYYNAIDYSNKSDVINKECAKLNQDVYMNHAEQWQFFIEESFIGSAALREVVARRLLLNVFRDVSDVDSEQEYIREIKEILSNPEISTNPNISVDYADVF